MTDLSKLSVAELRLALADHTHCISVGGYYAHITATQVFDELARRLEEAQRGRAVESDWPEYEPTWKAIEERMEQESNKVEAGLGRTYWMIEKRINGTAHWLMPESVPFLHSTYLWTTNPHKARRYVRELAEKNAALAVCANALALYANAKEIYHDERISDYAAEVLENLPEFAKQAAKVLEAAREHYGIERDKEKKGHHDDPCDCKVCQAVYEMKG